MKENKYDVIIIGGSYAGLSAAMALGRAIRKVLIIDGGKPCNRQTPHAHNFLTQDGKTPKEIAELARAQVASYNSIHFLASKVTAAKKLDYGFEVSTEAGENYAAKKLLFATGMVDEMPGIQGFAECWGISVLHCPYCHGYEVKGTNLGVLANGDLAFEFSKLIYNWSQQLTLYTNGPSTLSREQTEKLKSHKISVVEKEIKSLEHQNGMIKCIVLADGSKQEIDALFAKVHMKQHTSLPQELGCELTEQGLIKVDDFQKTTVPGVYAAGDNTTMFRGLSVAIGSGTKAGAVMNKEIIDESF